MLKRINYPTTAPKPLNYTEYIQLADKWYNTPPNQYKLKIRDIGYYRGIRARQLQEMLNISYTLADSFVNISHKSRIEFTMALRIANLFGCNVKDFL